MKLTRAQTQLARLLALLDGAEIPGGCDQCDAYQTVEPVIAGVWQMNIHHDNDCPFLAAYESQQT